ncbi:Mediator of RNA polymerase II transcription subunit 14 (Mediator complex subunit 14), partial [Durusdinium trenchii]
ACKGRPEQNVEFTSQNYIQPFGPPVFGGRLAQVWKPETGSTLAGPDLVGDGPDLVGEGPDLVGDGPDLVGEGPDLVGDGPDLVGDGAKNSREGPKAAPKTVDAKGVSLPARDDSPAAGRAVTRGGPTAGFAMRSGCSTQRHRLPLHCER